jgi:hypothetical protein
LLTKLRLTNFRGIENANFELAPITVLTGANNSGKSTVMYGLLVLKSLLANPNQPLDSFFNFLFMNLGGFKENLHLKAEESRRIGLTVESHSENTHSSFGVELGKSQSRLTTKVYKPFSASLDLSVAFPYPLNQSVGTVLDETYAPAKITWNGLSPTVSVEPKTGEAVDVPKVTQEITAALNSPLDDVKGIDFVPVRRGFTFYAEAV